MTKTIRDVISSKGNRVLGISSGATVYQALEKMAENNVGALVVKGSDEVVGIISERDYARKVILRGLSSLNTPVEKIMTTDVCYITPDNTVEEGLALMTDKRCRHLPVLEKGEMIGLVSIGDLVKAQVAEKEFIIAQLENYIRSG
ncbi:CBS domain protein [Geothermobacter ehrlichii]|uniref:CBS domain protein n=1 Tax=Geothermobacter ehrlichii TaxID=213224 RepID=A0A5D3WMY9_9BACT|nr:CBS domain-containing protein [Geothermobacter ehrlichii]TYO98960.1 CBS domain protein [Geothermobacter ehrlichii]